MLQDRGLLVQEGSRYVVTGDISDLDVPETLQALVASRLDGLSAGERSLLQDASVLGQSFTAAAAAAVSGRPESEVTDVLDRLVAKQVLARDDDPRSPERGQYVLPPGAAAHGRLRHAVSPRAQGPPRRRRAPSRADLAGRGSATSPRCSRPITWRRSAPIRTPTTSPRCAPRRARR